MSALQHAKQEGTAVTLEKIRQSGLQEYGIFPENLAHKIERIRAEHRPADGNMVAAGALNNQDTEHMLLFLLKEMPDKVLDGLEILAFLLDAAEMLLYVPEGEECLRETLLTRAKERRMEVRVEEGLADMRYLRGSAVCHIETLSALADAAEGIWKPGAWICSKVKTAEKEVYGKPVFAPYGTAVKAFIPEGIKEIKGVQMGAGLYGPEALDRQLTAWTAPGNGVITFYRTDCCMLQACEEELIKQRSISCGKCTFCREGLGQLFTRIHEITAGKGEWNGLAVMQEIGEAMPFSSLCSVGQTGAEFTLNTLKYFENEVEDHIKKHKCTVGQCLAFVNMYIEPSRCSGCGSCIPSCPADCIEGLPGYIHMIEDTDCTKCGKCMESCVETAIIKTTRRTPPIPDRLTHIGRFKRY